MYFVNFLKRTDWQRRPDAGVDQPGTTNPLTALDLLRTRLRMRRGEMLALRFADIDRARRFITLRGVTTKSGKTRVVPIGTSRLMAVLEWLRLDAAGGYKTDDTPVFSNEVGEATKTVRRAWTLTILRAHGIAPKWRKGTYKDLAAESQQQLQTIDLHWHDLRHEYASRLVERACPWRRCVICWVTRPSSRQSVTTTSAWKHCRLPWRASKTARRSAPTRTKFKIFSRSTGRAARRGCRWGRKKTWSLFGWKNLGRLVPVRGFEPRSRG